MNCDIVVTLSADASQPSAALRTECGPGFLYRGNRCWRFSRESAAGPFEARRLLGGVLHASLHILDPPAQLVGEVPLLTAVGIM